MAKQFFKNTDRAPPRLRRADVIDEVPEPQDHAKDSPPAMGEPIGSFGRSAHDEVPTTGDDHDADRYPTADDVPPHAVDEAEEAVPRRRSPLVTVLALLLLAGGAGYAIYVTDVGGLATKTGQMRAQLLGGTSTAAVAPATNRTTPPAESRMASTAPAVMPPPPVATAPVAQTEAAVPPPPNAEPMRIARPAPPAAEPGASIAEVAQQQQTERLREMLAATAKLARDTATQSNRQDARLAELEQRLATLAAAVAKMPTAIGPMAATTATDAPSAAALPELVIAGYTLTGSSQTAARVMNGGREEDLKIGTTHPVLGTIVSVKKYANGSDWRCNYELVTSSGVVRPAATICKAP